MFSNLDLTNKVLMERNRYEMRMNRCTELKFRKRERKRERRRNRRERRMRERFERKQKKRKIRENIMLAKNNVLRKERQRKLRKKLRKGVC